MVVLVVEDELELRQLLELWFASYGAHVYSADSVVAAVAILATNTIDILVSDIVMRDQDGYALIRHIRALEDVAKRGIPAIAFTTCACPRERQRCLDAGFTLHIAKPVAPKLLAEAVLSLAGRR